MVSSSLLSMARSSSSWEQLIALRRLERVRTMLTSLCWSSSSSPGLNLLSWPLPAVVGKRKGGVMSPFLLGSGAVEGRVDAVIVDGRASSGCLFRDSKLVIRS